MFEAVQVNKICPRCQREFWLDAYLAPKPAFDLCRKADCNDLFNSDAARSLVSGALGKEPDRGVRPTRPLGLRAKARQVPHVTPG